MTKRTASSGFTLIELSIVLVVIGLIIGSVLVGKDLINAAAIRAQITQIEKFNTAVNTFYVKYGYLPGDIPDPAASNFGFAARGTPVEGEGDGNGLIEGIPQSGQTFYGTAESGGETVMFWADLSAAKLIDGSFTMASPTVAPAYFSDVSDYFPQAKIGQSNYLLVYSASGANYFALEPLTYVTDYAWVGIWGTNDPLSGISPAQAYGIDSKVDDGLPTSGRVTASFLNSQVLFWSPISNGGTLKLLQISNHYPPGVAASPASGTCMDNGNNAAVAPNYTLSQTGNYCSLSLRMQAGD